MKRWTWGPITPRHIAQARKLRSTRDVVVYFSALILGCELDCPPPTVHYDRPIERADVDRLSGYSASKVRASFRQLELRLEVRRRFTGARSARAPFQLDLPFGTRSDGGPRGEPHAVQRGAACEEPTRSNGGPREAPDTLLARARRTDQRRSDPDPSVRSGGSGGRTDGRLEALAWELFPNQHRAHGREYLSALRAHPLAPSDRELAEFLRAMAADPSVTGPDVRMPLAVLAKSDRLEAWLSRRRRLRVVVPRPERDGVEEISASERAEVRSLVLDWTAKGRQA